MNNAPLTRESVLQLLQSEAAKPAYAEPAILFGPGLSSEQWAYLQAAAVLSYFNPNELRPVGSFSSATTQAIIPLLANSRLAHGREGPFRWILGTGARKEILHKMGTPEALRMALAANPTRSPDPLQTMLERYILAEPLNLEDQSQEELAATLQVIEWLEDILPDLPDRAKVQQVHARAKLLAPFLYLAGKNFIDREKEMKQLEDFVLQPVPSAQGKTALKPLLIHAAGGMGKSALLAKFILVHANNTDPSLRLPFVYLDFDRPELIPEEPLTLLADAIDQLGAQFAYSANQTEDLRERILRLLADRQEDGRSNEDLLVETREGTRVSEHFRSVEQRRILTTAWDRRSEFIAEFTELYHKLGLFDRPLLFALDTFEEVQYLSQDSVNEIWGFLDELAMHIPGLRPVVSGRVAVTFPRVGKKLIELQNLPLLPFGDKAAMDYLASQGVADSRLAIAIIKQVKGNPLSLWLAAEVVQKENVKPSEVEDLTAYLQSLGVTESLIQGQLYKRILNHIHSDDERVKAIAHPGLVLRRVTPELILKVLAKPCGIGVPDEITAKKLFNDLAREGSLVTLDEDGALVHRADIRRIMLELLQQDAPHKAPLIDRLAVRYYKDKPGARNRAEEIYHLLRLGKPIAEIDKRWMAGVEPYLRTAVEEVPSNVRHYLAAQLGATGDQYTWDEAGIAEWERYAEQRARDLVSLGKLEDALRVLAERKERTPQSPLFRLEAQILEQLGRWPEARRAAKDGILWATRSDNNPVLLDLFLLAARIDEKQGHHRQAAEMLSAAESLDVPLEANANDMLEFEICIQRLRLKRLAPDSVAASASDLESMALKIFDKTVDAGLRQRPDLVLSFVEEVGVAHPEVLERVLSLIHGAEALDEAEQQALAMALAAWDKQLSSTGDKEIGPLASAAGVTPDIDLGRSWLAFVESKDINALLAALQSFARQFTPTPDVVQVIVQILRSKAPSARGQRLTGELFDEVRTALFTIFDNRQALARMLTDALHVVLDDITGVEIYRDVLYELVEWAEDNDRMENLISATLERAPKEMKPGLSELLISYQESHPQPKAVTIPGGREEEPAISSGPAPAKQRDPSIDPPPGTIRSGEGTLVRPEMVYNWAVRMREAARAVCQVESGQGTGTGFLVAPNLLLTAAHVIMSTGEKDVSAHPGAVRFRFDYQHRRDGVTVKDGTVYTLAEDWLVDYKLDSYAGGDEFAMVRLEGTPGSDLMPGERVRRGWLDLEPDHDFQADEPFFVLGHYKGRPMQVECLSLYKLPTPNDDVLTFTNSNGISGPGAEGAPCFDMTWKVLGLRYASRFEDNQRQKGKLIIDCSPIQKIVGRHRVAQALKAALRLRAEGTTEYRPQFDSGRYRPQFYPGTTSVGINRRKHMSGNLEKLRDFPEADVVAIMGHRAPGADYSSTHPSLKETGEPYCPIRQIVAPTAGAAAGDRVRYSQWTDSMYFAPSTPYWRSYWGAINCKGCDPGTLSGRQIIEARERDIEIYTKQQYDSEMTDVALCSMRGCTVHGHSLRLEENGMQFDMLSRTEMGKGGNVYAIKDQVGIPLDRKINLGKPMTEAEAKKRTTIFRADGIPMCGKVGARKYDEAVEALHHMWELRSKWGFRPE